MIVKKKYAACVYICQKKKATPGPKVAVARRLSRIILQVVCASSSLVARSKSNHYSKRVALSVYVLWIDGLLMKQNV